MALSLETNQLLIREFAITDALFIVRLLNTPSWIKYIGDKGISTIRAAQQYIVERFHKGYEEKGYGAWLVSLKNTNEPVGLCGLFQRGYLEFPDIGFAFLPQFEGKGYAYEATAATIQYAIQQLKLSCLLAITQDDNSRSVRLLERCGFAYKETMLPPDENRPLLVFSRELPAEEHP